MKKCGFVGIGTVISLFLLTVTLGIGVYTVNNQDTVGELLKAASNILEIDDEVPIDKQKNANKVQQNIINSRTGQTTTTTSQDEGEEEDGNTAVTPPTQDNRCDADGLLYPESSVVVFSSGANDYRKCVNGRWTTDCGGRSCIITDLNQEFVPTYLTQDYNQAIADNKPSTDVTYPTEEEIQQRALETQEKLIADTTVAVNIANQKLITPTPTQTVGYRPTSNQVSLSDQLRSTPPVSSPTITNNFTRFDLTGTTDQIVENVNQYLYAQSTNANDPIANLLKSLNLNIDIYEELGTQTESRPVGLGGSTVTIANDPNYVDPAANAPIKTSDIRRNLDFITFGGFSQLANSYQPDLVNYKWEQWGYSSRDECVQKELQSNKPGGLANAKLCNTYDMTQDQLTSSIQLGTTVVAEGALAVAATGAVVTAATAGSLAGVAAPALTLLGQVGAISTVQQSGRAAVSCIQDPTSSQCHVDLSYAALSWANLGTADLLSYAFNPANTVTTPLAQAGARWLNTGVSGVNLVVDSFDAYDQCLNAGENFNLFNCGMASGALLFDAVGGVSDFRTGQLVYRSDIQLPNPLANINLSLPSKQEIELLTTLNPSHRRELLLKLENEAISVKSFQSQEESIKYNQRYIDRLARVGDLNNLHEFYRTELNKLGYKLEEINSEAIAEKILDLKIKSYKTEYWYHGTTSENLQKIKMSGTLDQSKGEILHPGAGAQGPDNPGIWATRSLGDALIFTDQDKVVLRWKEGLGKIESQLLPPRNIEDVEVSRDGGITWYILNESDPFTTTKKGPWLISRLVGVVEETIFGNPLPSSLDNNLPEQLPTENFFDWATRPIRNIIEKSDYGVVIYKDGNEYYTTNHGIVPNTPVSISSQKAIEIARKAKAGEVTPFQVVDDSRNTRVSIYEIDGEIYVVKEPYTGNDFDASVGTTYQQRVSTGDEIFTKYYDPEKSKMDISIAPTTNLVDIRTGKRTSIQKFISGREPNDDELTAIRKALADSGIGLHDSYVARNFIIDDNNKVWIIDTEGMIVLDFENNWGLSMNAITGLSGYEQINTGPKQGSVFDEYDADEDFWSKYKSSSDPQSNQEPEINSIIRNDPAPGILWPPIKDGVILPGLMEWWDESPINWNNWGFSGPIGQNETYENSSVRTLQGKIDTNSPLENAIQKATTPKRNPILTETIAIAINGVIDEIVKSIVKDKFSIKYTSTRNESMPHTRYLELAESGKAEELGYDPKSVRQLENHPEWILVTSTETYDPYEILLSRTKEGIARGRTPVEAVGDIIYSRFDMLMTNRLGTSLTFDPQNGRSLAEKVLCGNSNCIQQAIVAQELLYDVGVQETHVIYGLGGGSPLHAMLQTPEGVLLFGGEVVNNRAFLKLANMFSGSIGRYFFPVKTFNEIDIPKEYRQNRIER